MSEATTAIPGKQDENLPHLTKGERTAQRLMDVAERLFAERGFDGTTLRDVATAGGIREPGIYNHFSNKEALYCAVLERGLQPMADAIDVAAKGLAGGQGSLLELAELPSTMTDLLARHPCMPALFQQALMSNSDNSAHQMMNDWLGDLFTRGHMAMIPGGGELEMTERQKRHQLVRLIAMFNLCSGYFMAQRVFDQAGAGDLLAEENLEAQKKMLGKIIRLFMLE